MADLSLCLAVSAHLLLPGEWNSVHPCVRYEDSGFVAGAYLNSEYNLSAHVGGVWRRDSLFIEGGLVTGYSGIEVAPYVRAGIERDNVRYFIAPGMVKGEIGIVAGIEIFTGKDR